MNILDYISNKGVSLVRVSRTGKAGRGAEYQGPCPVCRAGTNRFHVWPEQGAGGTWWCRHCNQGGDVIKLLMECDGMGFKEACAAAGREVPAYDRKPFGTGKAMDRPVWAPAAVGFPEDVNASKWREHAGKFVERCHAELFTGGDEVHPAASLLVGRGIDAAAVARQGLGWHAGENGRNSAYRDRTAWGLPDETKDDGRRKMLWLPRGLVIPYYVNGDLVRVRIRRPAEDLTPEFDLKYYVVQGSSAAPMLLGPDRKAFVVVEAELDAIAVHAAAGDVCGALAVLTSHGKPDKVADAALRAADVILVALDADDAGRKGSEFWLETYPRAKRWPVPEAKDPGDAVAAGVDLREWIMAGLPPVYKIAPSVRAKEKPAPTAAAKTNRPSDAACPRPDQLPGAGKLISNSARPDVPAGVSELYALLKQYPVKIVNQADRTGIINAPAWRDLGVIGRISKLLFFDKDVLDYVTSHPAETVHRGNFWMGVGK